MAAASLIAGLAFGQPKTTASHACSFPLTNLYHIPHGEACGLTLDFFIRLNGTKDFRTRELTSQLGFYDYEQFAEQFYQKISTFDKSLKIYAYVNKKCLKIQRRLSELNTYAQPMNTTSNGGFDKVPPTRIISYAFSHPKECGMKVMY